MDPSPEKIRLISPSRGESLWDETARAYAKAAGRDIFHPPRWIVADGRHRRAAELALLRMSGRSGGAIGGIGTLASLAGEILGWPVQTALASPTIASLALVEILSKGPPEAFRSSCDKPGFASAFWSAVMDAESRGHFPRESINGAHGGRSSAEFRDLQARLHESLRRRHLCTPGQFLLSAIRALEKKTFERLPKSLFIGPILNLSALDRALVRALIGRADRAHLALPPGLSLEDWLNLADDSPMANTSASVPHSGSVAFLRPLTPEAEFNAVFALMAEWVARKECHYRDIRLIHPFLADDFPRIESAARRYQVPLRGATALPLSRFPGAILLLKVLDLFESPWGRQQVMDILRTRLLHAPQAEISRAIARLLETPDRRSNKPWMHWVEMARGAGAKKIEQDLLQLSDLDQAGSNRMAGSAFVVWLESLSDFIRRQHHNSDSSDEDVQLAAYETAGWEALAIIFDAMRRSFPQPLECSALAEILRRSLESADYEPPADSVDAVEICSGHLEDHLPCKVVFYVSLNSRLPSPGKTSPFLGESHAPNYGEQLRLFQLQIANAQERLILSCPQYDDEGDRLALSPFLSSLTGLAQAEKAGENLLPGALNWAPFHTLSPRLRLMTQDARGSLAGRAHRQPSRQILKQSSRRWSSTRLANAIQCLYLHFAGDVLRIEPQADAMIEAATPALLGSIAHKVLEKSVPELLQGRDFDMAQICREHFRKMMQLYEPHLETDRAEEELVRCLSHFAELGWEKLASDFTARTDRLELGFGEKKKYSFLTLGAGADEYLVEGIIDRLDQTMDGRALIIEYKYRKTDSESKDEFYQALLEGKQPQLPLYALAAERLMGLQTAALIQIYLRSAEIRGLKMQDLSPSVEDADFLEITAEQKTQMATNVQLLLDRKAGSITAGVLTAFPDDFDSCGPGACPYADLCRYRGKPYDVNGRK